MVLPPPGSGRVGHRRAHTKGSEAPHNHHPHTTRGHTGCVGPPHTPRAGLLDALCWFVEAWFSLVSLGFLGVRVSSPPVHPQAFCAGRTQGFRCNSAVNPLPESLISWWGPRTYRVARAAGFRGDGAGIAAAESGATSPTRACRSHLRCPWDEARRRRARHPCAGFAPLWTCPGVANVPQGCRRAPGARPQPQRTSTTPTHVHKPNARPQPRRASATLTRVHKPAARPLLPWPPTIPAAGSLCSAHADRRRAAGADLPGAHRTR